MIKRFLFIITVLLTANAFAQEGNTSPYSYYGIGLREFKGTVENQAMGGLNILGDSIHTNLSNPAGYGALKLTNFALGGSRKDVNLKEDQGKGTTASTTFDYLSLSFPVSKQMGAGFGLLPYSSVDYKINNTSGGTYEQFYGRGGINRAFVTLGYEFFNSLRLGARGSYNFGNIRRESIQDDDSQQYGIQEVVRSDISGISLDFGLQYETKIKSNLSIYSSLTYSPELKLSSENRREISSIASVNRTTGQVTVRETNALETTKTDFNLPEETTVGLGFGQQNKWFAGAQYENIQASNFRNPSFSLQDVRYDNASKYRLGGFFVPRFNSISSYWERVVYRAGVRYEETGLNINGEGINEFGISFGLGLPMGRAFSNANLSFEYGQRGTTNAGLIREDFFKIGLSLSLNDKWFVPFKFN